MVKIERKKGKKKKHRHKIEIIKQQKQKKKTHNSEEEVPQAGNGTTIVSHKLFSPFPVRRETIKSKANDQYKKIMLLHFTYSFIRRDVELIFRHGKRPIMSSKPNANTLVKKKIIKKS